MMLGAVKKTAAGGIVGYTKEGRQRVEDWDMMHKLCPGWENSISTAVEAAKYVPVLFSPNSLIHNANVNKR